MSKKLVELLTHPTELEAVVRYFWFRNELHPLDLNKVPPTLKRSYELLKHSSRSFAAVIMELNPILRDSVMLFYMVLRALDTLEDDMTLDPAIKIPLLRNFTEKLDTKDWTFNGSGPNENDRVVLVEFDKILTEYHKLKPSHKVIIRDITHKMGNGMADYILDEQVNANGLETNKDFDLYCHYVAGLVGEGLTRLIVDAKFAPKTIMDNNFQKPESMGLFLQKTNIIRDYHDDLLDGRSFWPKETWSKYTDSLFSFHNDGSKESEEQGVWCINELALNSLNHVKEVLEFLSSIQDPSSFSFCAIPQVMAIATLELVMNNPQVLHRNVKIRKGTTCSLILESRTFPGVVAIFKRYVSYINQKSNVRDPNYLKIGIKCGEITQFCELIYPTSLPAGAVRNKQEINRAVELRQAVDQSIQKRIDEEHSTYATVVYGNIVFGIGLILFYFFRR